MAIPPDFDPRKPLYSKLKTSVKRPTVHPNLRHTCRLSRSPGIISI
uniref:Uncharacterized protein n=1 Tax=Arundo donax TaxID=35708 RepID=A0A0A9FTY3_ARUDO